MPAPRGNKNAMRHGKFGYLAIGSLPRDASYIRRMIGEFATAIQEAVVAKHGAIDLYRAAVAQTACRHEARAHLLQRWLRRAETEGTPISLTERVAIMREIGAASDSRDKCLRMLGLDQAETGNMFDALYASPTPTNAPQPGQATTDAAAATDGGEPGDYQPNED